MEGSLKIVGEYGNFQNHIKIIIFSCAFLTDIYLLQISLMLKSPKINIIEKGNFKDSDNQTLLSMYLLPNLTNIDNQYCDKNKYIIQIDNSSSLKNWNYNYNFFCENEWYIITIIISLFIGIIFGLLFFSTIPDRIGREKIFKYSIIFSCFLHLNLLFCRNNFHLILINFFGGLNSFIYPLSLVCITEYLPQDSNGINIGIFNFSNTIYAIILYIFLQFFNNWKIIFFFTSIAHIFMASYTWKNFLESPRWLFSIGQKIKCLSVLDKISLYNGTLSKWNEYQRLNIENANRFGRASTNFTKLFNFVLDSGELEQENKGITTYEIFNFKSQTKKIIILAIICFISNFNLSGISFILFSNCKDYINTLILIYISKIIIGMITGYLCDNIGRKPFAIFGGSIGSIIYFIYTENNYKLFLIISLFCFQALNLSLLIYIPENIPTPIRSTLCGWLFLMNKITPIIIILFHKNTNNNIFNYSIIILGFMGGFCTLYMKETLGIDIPDIIPELKDKIENLENINLKSFHSSEYPSFLEEYKDYH